MCMFFEYAACGHKYHVPSQKLVTVKGSDLIVDDEHCPPAGHPSKDPITGLWSGGCALPMNDVGFVEAKEVPLTCLLLADPGLGA